MTLEPFVLSHDIAIRLGSFASVFALVALAEVLAPRRKLTLPRTMRWTSNLSLVLLNNLLLRLLFPAAAVGVAAFCTASGWGLLNHFAVPLWLAVPLAVITMDFVIWLQHVMVHAVPLLWRLHQVHHADLDYDLTTGARFHPIEIMLSMLIKFATITLLGAPVLAVVIFEVLLNATAMFNHGNIRLPTKLDAALRWLIVTPDMHRVHHSVEDDECNSNFGFNLTWWDRLLGTYRAQARASQTSMAIGLRGHTSPNEVAHLGGMLLMPFKTEADGYAINRRDWAGKNAR